MKCNKCNSIQPEGVMFCTNCGNKIEAHENVSSNVVPNFSSNLSTVADPKMTYSEPPSINMPLEQFFNPMVAAPIDMPLSMPQKRFQLAEKPPPTKKSL